MKRYAIGAVLLLACLIAFGRVTPKPLTVQQQIVRQATAYKWHFKTESFFIEFVLEVQRRMTNHGGNHGNAETTSEA